MPRRTKYPPEVRERAVRMVFEHQGDYESQWAAIVSIASKAGMTAETGSTTAGCTPPSATSHPPSSKRTTTVNSSRQPTPRLKPPSLYRTRGGSLTHKTTDRGVHNAEDQRQTGVRARTPYVPT